MKRADKLISILFVLALIGVMVAPRVVMAEEQKSVAMPDIADLIPLATELSGGLAALEKNIAVGLDTSVVEKSLSGIVANLEDHSGQLQKLKAAGDFRYDQLTELDEALKSEARSLAKVNRPLTETIRRLGASRRVWLAEKEQWKEWRSSLLKDEPFDEVKSTFAQAQKTIDTALQLILQQLKPMLAVQKEAGNIQARIDSIAAEVDGLILSKRGGVLVDSSPPMLSSRYFSQFGGELWYGVRRGLDEVSLPGERFFARQGWVVLLQGMLSLALIIAIFRNRQQLQESERWRFVAERPFSAGLFLGLATTVPFYHYGGFLASWRLAYTLVAGISFARLVEGLTEAAWKRQFVYALLIFLIVTRLFYLVSLPLPLFRLYILVAVLVGIFLCLRWAGKSGRRGDSPLYPWLLRLGSCFLVVIMVAELWGRAGLAEYLLLSSIGTIGTTLFFWLFIYLFRGGLEWALHSSPLQRVTLLRSNADAIVRRVALFFDVLVGGLVLSAFLVLWRVYDSLDEAIKALLSSGFNLGAQRISVGLVIAAAALLYGSFLISWIIQRLLMDEVLARRGVDKGIQLSVGRLVHYALVLIGFLMALMALGFELTKVTIIVSALGVGIGFGLQGIVNNFVSGLILLFERPIKVGDYIQLGEQWAAIKKIGLRATVVETFDRSEIIVPNSDLVSNQVTNWTLSHRMVRVIIPVGVEYSSDVPLVTETLMECAMANSKVMRMPEPQVLFLSFGESSLDFQLRVWISDIDERLLVTSELHHEIDRRFREAGIVIAFPQRDLHVRSVEESPGSILKPSEERRPDLVVVSREERDEEED